MTAKQKSLRIIREFGDLSVESNRVAFVEAMVLDKALPANDGHGSGIEAAFMTLESGAMHEIIATQMKLYKTFRKQAEIVLNGLA